MLFDVRLDHRVRHRTEFRRIGMCARVLDHWVSDDQTNQALLALDDISSSPERAMLALHLGAKSKGLPAADMLDLSGMHE